MLNLKKSKSSETINTASHHARFQEAFFAALSETIFTDRPDNIVGSIVSAVGKAFDCHSFLFSRSGGTAALTAYSADNPKQIADSFKNAGIRLSTDKIPLTGGRKKAFEEKFTEFDEIFQLLGDMTTSAACRKLQRELGAGLVAAASVKTDASELALLLLLREKPPALREDLGRFVFLLKAASHLSEVKSRLQTLQNRFDEQLVKLKGELREKESSHLHLFNEMALAAAVLDERGIIVEANEALTRLAGPGVEPQGQSFSSLVDEDARQGFIEFLVGIGAGESRPTSVVMSGKHFKTYVVTRKKPDGGRGLSAVYLSDDTSDIELRNELGRTIDALRSENEALKKSVGEAREFSEESVRGAALPVMAVSNGIVSVLSRPVREMFDVKEGQQVGEFLSSNGLVIPTALEGDREVVDNRGRAFSVAHWDIAGISFYAFRDVSGFKKIEEELRKSAMESERLFNSFLPTAAVSGGKLSRWNEMFESLFKEFLSTDRSFDGFLRYLGESPESFKSELRAGEIVMRMCRTTDRKYLNARASVTEDATFLFLEDITEQEVLKQQLRGAQGMLGNLLESFVDDPVFVLESGIVRAANVAARNKLSIRLDESIDPTKILAGIGISRPEDTGELNGRFYKVENIPVGNTQVYRFRPVSQEVGQRAEIEKLKRRNVIMRDLPSADKFEGILKSLSDLLAAELYSGAKVIGTGTLHTSRGTADVFLLTAASGRMEPSLSLSLTESDVTVARHGGAFSGIEIPDSTLMNVVSAGDSRLLLQSTAVGDVLGFASISFPSSGVQSQYMDELAPVLKAASSVAAGLYARMSAERRFEESGKVTRAVVGLTGMGDGSFDEYSRHVTDLVRHVFAAESAGVYALVGTAMSLVISNGNLPKELSLPATKFGALVPANQLESPDMKGAEGLYFAVKSRRQLLVLLLRFIAVSPSISELNAVASVSLDMLEGRKSSEEQAKIAAQLLENSKIMSEFMMKLSKAGTPEAVVKVLADSLSAKMKESSVVLSPGNAGTEASRPMELVEKDGEGSGLYEADFASVGMGLLSVKSAGDPLSSTMVGLSVDKIKSIFAMRLPALQAESSVLRSRLDRAKEEQASLRESIENIPVSLRNARIAIDNVLSRLSFVQGEDKILQEIRLHLAAAAKEMSVDLDSSSKRQDELFEAVRTALINSAGTGSVKTPTRIKSFETSSLAEFRVDQSTFDLLRDLLSNVVLVSGLKECDVLAATSQPGPGDAAEGKGKRVGLRLTGAENETVDQEQIEGSASIRALVGKIEKLGYTVEADVQANVMTFEIFESRPAEGANAGVISALLVEDDKHLVEEESRNILLVFPRLKVAGDAVEAAKLFRTEKFSVAFVDLSLPSINGRELCGQLKKAHPDCTTVLLTNREGEEKSEGVDYISLRPLESDTITRFRPM